MHIRYLFSALLLASAVFSSLITTVTAGEIKTYEFVDTGERTLRLSGGIASDGVYAKVGGKFEVEFFSDGTNEVRSFDSYVYDVEGSLLNENQRLSELLFQSPLGISVSFTRNLATTGGLEAIGYSTLTLPTSNLESQQLNGVLSNPNPLDDLINPTTRISVDVTSEGILPINISSFNFRLSVISDAPHRIDTDGLSVRLVSVPEPNSILLLLAALPIFKQIRCKRCKHRDN